MKVTYMPKLRIWRKHKLMKFHYADWIAYNSYAILINFENNRRPKRTK